MSLENFLYKYSKLIDNVDMYLGPVSSICNRSDIEYFQILGSITKSVDLGLKIPFSIIYFCKTRNIGSISYWFAKETFAATVPYGGFVEMFRSYEKIVKKDFFDKL